MRMRTFHIVNKNQSGRPVLPHGVAASAGGADVYVSICPLFVGAYVCVCVCVSVSFHVAQLIYTHETTSCHSIQTHNSIQCKLRVQSD